MLPIRRTLLRRHHHHYHHHGKTISSILRRGGGATSMRFRLFHTAMRNRDEISAEEEEYAPLTEKEKDMVRERFPQGIAKLVLLYLDSEQEVISRGQMEGMWHEQEVYRHKVQLKDEVYEMLGQGKVDTAKMVFESYYKKYLMLEEQEEKGKSKLTLQKSRQHLLIDAVLLGYYGVTVRQFEGEEDNAMNMLALSLRFFDMFHARERDFSDEELLEDAKDDEKKRAEKEKKRRKNVRRMDHMVCVALGTLHFNRDEFAQAKECLERGLQNVPHDERCLFMLALIGEYTMDYDDAEKYYLLLEEHHGANNPNLLGDISCFYKDCKKDFAAAERKLQKALEMDPKHSNNFYNYAVLCMNGFNDLDRAEHYFQKAINADKEHSPSLSKYGTMLMMSGELERARGMLKSSTDYDPFQTDTLCNLAYVEHQLGHLQEAETTFKRALVQWEEDESLRNRQEKVKQDRKTGTESHPNAGASPLPIQELGVKDFNVATLFSNYANLLADLKKYRKAEEMYKKALETQPDNISVLGNYAVLLDASGKDQDTVRKLYENALNALEKKVFNESFSKLSEEIKRETLSDLGAPHKNNLENFAVWLLDEVNDKDAAVSHFAKIVQFIEEYELPILGEEHVANQLVTNSDVYRNYAKLVKSSDAQLASKLRQRSKELKAHATVSNSPTKQ